MIALLLNAAYALLLIVFSRGWKHASVAKSPPCREEDLPEVSVIIPVRNEAKNIARIMDALKRQDYPAHRTTWIFIDDHSEDDTRLQLEKENDARLKIVSLREENQQGKKAALTQGVLYAKSEWILTSDADCSLPAGWIRAFVQKALATDARMVCGLVKVEGRKNALTSFQAMETAVLQCCAAGSLYFGYPLLNTGASLAFRKSAWLDAKGYTAQEHIASGDDTFLMLGFNQKFPCKVVALTAPAAVASTRPMETMMDVLQQRLRWNGKVKHYPAGYIHFVGWVVMLAALSFLWSLLQLFAESGSFTMAGLVLVLRFSAEWWVLRAWRRVTGQFFSLFEIVWMSLFYPLFTVLSFVIRPFVHTAWKGRKL